MEERIKATWKWIPYNEGGRKEIIPKGIRYSPLIRLDKDWSITFICTDTAEMMDIEFSFLANKAPVGLLKQNVVYDIYEGLKKVAVLTVK